MAFVYLRHDRYALALLGVAVVLVVARVVGSLFGRFRQPPVIGEVLAGVALGPSLLGDGSGLVVLGIGRGIGVFDERLFTLLVVMAVVTTVATGAFLDIVRPDPSLGRPDAP